MTKRNPHTGSTLDSLLAKTGALSAARELAATKAIALELTAAMVDQQMTKVELAKLAGTSRSQLDRVLGGVTAASVDSVERIASALGKQLVVRLEDAPVKRNGKVSARKATATKVRRPTSRATPRSASA
jgi:antitoxin HicB